MFTPKIIGLRHERTFIYLIHTSAIQTVSIRSPEEISSNQEIVQPELQKPDVIQPIPPQAQPNVYYSPQFIPMENYSHGNLSTPSIVPPYYTPFVYYPVNQLPQKEQEK